MLSARGVMTVRVWVVPDTELGLESALLRSSANRLHSAVIAVPSAKKMKRASGAHSAGSTSVVITICPKAQVCMPRGVIDAE